MSNDALADRVNQQSQIDECRFAIAPCVEQRTGSRHQDDVNGEFPGPFQFSPSG
ncbi:hypothetical protein K227x_05640 [Rubripirellula lacrimiformis]|uniref:Uncharacterized protein n=1 Tax=Rubripirellula lacrimiformis TaxID=1930273 RepID=A0A517N4Y8_9BACT|nr:hypothetical protein K227x_05640 [Rubripirellula lacrimiformis]